MEKEALAFSKSVVRVEKLPLSVLRLVTLVEKLPESVFKFVILVEKLELSAVILVDKLPESVFKLVTLVEKLLESAVKFKAVTLPVTFKEPVKVCVSSMVSPNIVEPLLNEEVIIDTDEDTIYLSA